MCVICLNYGIIILIIIIIGRWKYIVIAYFKHTTRTVLIITHYTRKGYVIIPKPNCQTVYSRCRRFDFSPSPFRHLAKSIATTDLYKSVVATIPQLSPFRMSLFGGSLTTNCDAVNAPFQRQLAIYCGRWLVQSNKHSRGRYGFSEFSGVFTYKKCYVELRRELVERKCFQSIRTVGHISRDDRARITTCRLRTATNR